MVSPEVHPLLVFADTSYVLMAEKTPGCFARDTILIKVYHSPVIDLGSDTSFCSGDSLMLNAGTGFATFSWNTGDDSQVITASKAGVYIVSAKTRRGFFQPSIHRKYLQAGQ